MTVGLSLCSAEVMAVHAEVERINVDVTLYRKHQVCMVDVRGVAGKITAFQLVPSVGDRSALEELMVLLYWDGEQTPFIVCSVKELRNLLAADGTPIHLPEPVFSNGFRIFVECVAGKGGRLQGSISYTKTAPPSTSKRVRFDPGLGVHTPQLVETVGMPRSDTRRGRGEAVAVPNAGFESGSLGPWKDVSWEPEGLKERFGVYPTGIEGVQAHSGKFMAGIVRGGNCVGLMRADGLVPGYRYRLSAWVNTYGIDEQGHADKAKARLGINTVGTFLTKLHPEEGDLWTTKFSHEKFYFAHCWGSRMYAQSHDHWSRISVSTRAESEVGWLFLEGSQLLGDVRKWCLFDDVTLENVPIPMGTIEGGVVNGKGKGIKRAPVAINPWGFATITSGNGRFRITDVPEGTYAIHVGEGAGIASLEGVRVLAGRTTKVEFVLAETSKGRIIPTELGDTENRLMNGDFESGDTMGWERAYVCDGMGVVGATKRVAPEAGEFMFGGEHVYHYAGAREIIYQRVAVSNDSRWTLSGRLFAHSATGGQKTWCRLVVDPQGGSEFPIVSSFHRGEWDRVSVSFTADSDEVAVGVEMRQGARASAGLSDERGIVGHLPRENVRTDYEGYYCDDLHLVPAGGGAELAQLLPRTGRATTLRWKPAALPDADETTIILPDRKTEMELIRIPAGRFLMGGDSRSGWARDDEFPRHPVNLDSYWVGKYEVTNAQYRAFCDHQNYPYPPDPGFGKIPWVHRDRVYHYGDYFTEMPDYPVVNVTWEDAQAFCVWAGLRLPTEAEWEMGARGHGDSLRTYPWGEQTDPTWTTRSRDNTCLQVMPDGYLYTAPVGRFETHKRPYCIGKSIFGVCEMGGNVREWCSDWYGPYSAGEQTNPEGPCTGTERVIRGGCWRGRDYGVMTRCSYRWHHDPNYYEWGTTGFRVAIDGRRE